MAIKIKKKWWSSLTLEIPNLSMGFMIPFYGPRKKIGFGIT
jgi:hypothetical protein